MVTALRHDGTEFPLEASISRAVMGGEVRCTVIMRDVTERERLQSELRASTGMLRRTVDNLPMGVAVIDADVLEELEYALITADLGARTTSEILERIRERVARHQVNDIGELKKLIREYLLDVLKTAERDVPLVTRDRALLAWAASSRQRS